LDDGEQGDAPHYTVTNQKNNDAVYSLALVTPLWGEHDQGVLLVLSGPVDPGNHLLRLFEYFYPVGPSCKREDSA